MDTLILDVFILMAILVAPIPIYGMGRLAIMIFSFFSGKIRKIDEFLTNKELKINKKIDAKAQSVISLFAPLSSVIPAAKAIIISNGGYIAVSVGAERAYESNAPPTAPPSNDATYDTVAALISPIFADLIESDRTQTSYFLHLSQPENQKFILEKINQKVQARDEISLDFLKLNGTAAFRAFENFETAVKGETERLILTILRNNAGTDRQEPIIRAARASLHRRIDSMDAPLRTDIDGRIPTLHDIIPSSTPDPLSILLSQEQAAQEQAALDAIPNNEKVRIIAEYDARQLARKGLLFDLVQPPDDDPDPAPPTVKPPRPRRDRSRQLDLFEFAGGAI